MRTIGLVVSGHGEVEAAPILIRRVLHDVLEVYDITINRVIRKPESKLLRRNDDTLEKTVKRLCATHDAVLVLIDLEDDCPATMSPWLVERVNAVCGHKPTAVVCAYRELETWFIWDAQHLFATEPLADPESRRDAKGWIRQETGTHAGYNERADSPSLCDRLQILPTRTNSDSFRVFTDRVRDIAVELSEQTVQTLP